MKIEECLIKFIEICDKLQNYRNANKLNQVVLLDEVSVEIMKSLYNGLSSLEKHEMIKVFDSINDVSMRIYIYSIAIEIFNCEIWVDTLLDTLLDTDMEAARLLFHFNQIESVIFRRKLNLFIEKRTLLKKKILNALNIEQYFKYEKYENRNKKKLVFIMEQFLGVRHSPSLVLANWLHVFNRLGYEVSVISLNMNNIEKRYCLDLCNTFYSNNIMDETGKYKVKIFGKQRDILNIKFHADNLNYDLLLGLAAIYRYNPEFVIDFGGTNILSDLCTNFTTVVALPCVNELPVCMTPYVIRYFQGEYTESYKQSTACGKKVYDVPYSVELRSEEEEPENIELPKDRFLISIVGNRLDQEVDSDMISYLKEVSQLHEQVEYVIIGSVSTLKQNLDSMNHKCHFLGYVKNLKKVLSQTNLFFNPKRVGGGGGALQAIQVGVPVFTMGECDVSAIVGDKFVYDSFEEFKNVVDRYINDDEYAAEQQKNAHYQYNKVYLKDNDKLFSNFCEELVREIIINEEKMFS